MRKNREIGRHSYSSSAISICFRGNQICYISIVITRHETKLNLQDFTPLFKFSYISLYSRLPECRWLFPQRSSTFCVWWTPTLMVRGTSCSPSPPSRVLVVVMPTLSSRRWVESLHFTDQNASIKAPWWSILPDHLGSSSRSRETVVLISGWDLN